MTVSAGFGCRVRQASIIAIAATLATTFASLVVPSVAQAATLTVTSTADSGPGSFRDVVANAADGDTVTFAPSVTGTISLASPITVLDAITITGPGAGVLTIDGQNQVQDLVIDPLAQNVSVSGLTLTRGHGVNGGAVVVEASLALNGVRITNSSATDGGGIFSDGTGSLSLVNSTVNGNTAYTGGGVYAFVQATTGLSLKSSTISGNTATSGQGAAVFASEQSDQNTDTGKCDGECCDNECCDSECCGLDCEGCPPFCGCPPTCTFARPEAVTAEPDAETPTAGAVTIVTSTIAENTARGGDAVHLVWLDNKSSIVSSTIGTNAGGGLGIDSPYDPPILVADIVAGNTTDCPSGPWTDSGYNVDGDGSCGLTAAGSQSGAAGIAAALGGLADNGGPTQTEALALTSDPAHDAVSGGFMAPGASAPLCDGPDQRGVLPPNSPCDAGAYQVAGAPTVTAQLSSDGERSSYGWFHTAVHVTFACTSGSPLLTVQCSPPTDVTTEGKHTVTGTATQSDGQTASVTRHVKIDETAPTVQAHAGRSYTSAHFFTCSDALSGIASCTTHRKTLDDGTMKYKVVAIDKADNKTVRRGSFGDAFTSAG